MGIFDKFKKAADELGITGYSSPESSNEESSNENNHISGPSKKQRREAIDVYEFAKKDRIQSEEFIDEPQNIHRTGKHPKKETKYSAIQEKAMKEGIYGYGSQKERIKQENNQQDPNNQFSRTLARLKSTVSEVGIPRGDVRTNLVSYGEPQLEQHVRSYEQSASQKEIAKRSKGKVKYERLGSAGRDISVAMAGLSGIAKSSFGQSFSMNKKQERKLKKRFTPSNRKYQTVRARSMSAYQTLAPTTHGYVAPRMPSKKGSKGNRTRALSVGRPRGVYKYNIPGRGPVHVYEYRKWLRRSQAMQRLQAGLPSQPQYNQQYSQYQQQYAQQRYPPVSAPPQNPYQQPQPNSRPYPEYQQQNPQIRSDNILHAPNIFKGELTNVGQNNPIISSANMNRPVSNPRGDQYIEVDPMSGKQILRTRSRERWLTGDPL
jgi:hypothetical protein